MKKFILPLFLAAVALFTGIAPTQAATVGKLNWLSGDTGIVLRGGMPPAGYVLGRPTAGDTLGWLVGGTGTVTAVTGTTPIVSSGGATPAISVGGLTTNGTASYFLTSTGSGWQYEAPTGTSSPVRATGGTLTNPVLVSPVLSGTPELPASFLIASNTFARSGAHNLTLTTTATTAATFPTGTVTLAGLSTAQTWTGIQKFTGNAATVSSLNAFNPVTQTASFMTQFQDVLDALGTGTLGIGILNEP